MIILPKEILVIFPPIVFVLGVLIFSWVFSWGDKRQATLNDVAFMFLGMLSFIMMIVGATFSVIEVFLIFSCFVKFV